MTHNRNYEGNETMNDRNERALHEECGVFGIYDRSGSMDLVQATYGALYALQHRGQ